MSQNNFIQIQDLFVSNVENRRHSHYKPSETSTYEEVDDTTKWRRYEFQNFVIINPNSPGKTDGHLKLGETESYYYQPYGEEKDDYHSIGKLLKSIKDLIKKAEIKDPKFEAFCTEMKEAALERQAFYKKYGKFTLSITKGILSDEDVACLRNLSENVDGYLEEAQEINKKTKELKKKFKTVISPYIREHYHHNLYKRSGHYNQDKTETQNAYAPVKDSFYFPLLSFSKNSALLFEEIKKYNLRKENFLNAMSSVEEKNAKKKINGYVIYHNATKDGDAEEEDGFVNKNGYLTENILSALVFETTKLAYAYAKRRGYASQTIITEINFEFSKIMENYDCVPGPAMNSLISRREQGDLKEIFGEMDAPQALEGEQLEASDVAPKKKNKI